MTTMQVYEIRESFGVENLILTERLRPAPGPNQLLLRMKAASLNYRDYLVVRGLYNPRQSLPLIPFSDGVGEVVEVGVDVDRAAIGDRVCPIFAQRWFSGAPTQRALRSTLGSPLDGALAEYMLVDQESVVHVPDYLSDEEAATLPCAAVTAWSALVTLGQLRAGETVLLQGTGGVSLFALQIAKLHGATVIITSSSDDKLARAIELGADHGINYKQDSKWGKSARQQTPHQQGVDHVVEVGGASTLAQSLRAIKPGGQISMIGVLSGTSSDVNLLPILMQQVRIQGVLVGHREGFETMVRAFEAAEVRPVIDTVYPFSDVQQALTHMGSATHFGKICIHIAD